MIFQLCIGPQGLALSCQVTLPFGPSVARAKEDAMKPDMRWPKACSGGLAQSSGPVRVIQQLVDAMPGVLLLSHSPNCRR